MTLGVASAGFTQTASVQNDGRFASGEWATGNRSIVTQKIPRPPKYEIYEYKFQSDGAVSIRTKLRHKFRNPGQSQPAVYPLNQIPGEMRWLCRNVYGTDLSKMITVPNTKIGLIRGPEYKTNIVAAKCASREEFATAAKRQADLIAAKAEADRAAKQERMRETKKAARATIEQRKANCSAYGFTPNTDGHAKCVMELSLAAEEAEQQKIDDIARASAMASQAAASRAAVEAATDEARRQRQAQALINLGSVISSGGASPSPSSSVLTKPSSSGLYKTCSYRVSGEIVPMTFGRAELCPTTRLIGGHLGVLIR